MSLNAVAQLINDAVLERRGLDTDDSVPHRRRGYVELLRHFSPTETACEVTPYDVAGMAALRFTPAERGGGLLVWFHSGGWVLGSPSLSISEMDLLCATSRCVGLSVDYRLAPEHRLPAAQLDGIEAARWAIEHAAELGCDPARVAVGGDSAGGNLAAVASQRVEGLCAQVLVYPGCDLTTDWDDVPYPQGYLLDAAWMRWFLAQCAPDVALADPLVSPGLADAEVLSRVPPAFVVTAEYDPLLAMTLAYVERLRDAGAHVEHAHFAEVMHLFFSMPSALADAKVAIALASSFLSTQFEAR